MICPRDNVPLTKQVHANRQFYFCDKCHGSWFHKHDLQALLNSSDEPKVFQVRGDPENVHLDSGQVLQCPVNGHAPMKQFFRDYVHVDACREHNGIWVDGDEFQTMMKSQVESKKSLGYMLLPRPLNYLFLLFYERFLMWKRTRATWENDKTNAVTRKRDNSGITPQYIDQQSQYKHSEVKSSYKYFGILISIGCILFVVQFIQFLLNNNYDYTGSDAAVRFLAIVSPAAIIAYFVVGYKLAVPVTQSGRYLRKCLLVNAFIAVFVIVFVGWLIFMKANNVEQISNIDITLIDITLFVPYIIIWLFGQYILYVSSLIALILFNLSWFKGEKKLYLLTSIGFLIDSLCLYGAFFLHFPINA